MKQIPLFEIPVWVTPCENNDKVKSYIDNTVVPAYLKNTGRDPNPYETFYDGAVTGGSMKHLSIVEGIEQTGKQSDDNGLTSVYSDYFESTNEEVIGLQKLVLETKKILDEKFQPDGFNVGINSGETGGQTVPHVHIHLIPRYKGDMENPRGGVRGVIPSKQKY